MTAVSVPSTVETFFLASRESLDGRFKRLAAALWEDGRATDAALPAVPALVARLDADDADDVSKGHLALLLGLLAETSFPATGGEVHAAVRRGLGGYLRLVRLAPAGSPLSLALLYLLAHFPGDRDAILAAVRDVPLEAADRTRLERSLRVLDPADPDLGRVWPSPAVWALDDAERGFDRAWIERLSPEQVVANWDNDTHMVLAYSGAKAYWAVTHDLPVAEEESAVIGDTLSDAPPHAPADVFRRHAGVFRCPGCEAGRLRIDDGGARCSACATAYPIAGGILDLSAGVQAGGVTDEATSDLLRKLAEMPSMGLYYESVLRPAFLRIAGSNWAGQVLPEVEDRYLAGHVRPTDGPVLDLAAGAGRWTSVIASTAGAERVIALDAGLSMLNVLRRRLPAVPAVLGDALRLPFSDASLGAVTCWNALQAVPEDAGRLIEEVGRCLRPAGTFTLMTFRMSADPIARYFQAGHHFPSRPEGMLLFEPHQVQAWLENAGLAVTDWSAPGTFLFATAVRKP
ncbi:class I SAM-dependent methyltransferase [Nonomuraea sp. NPDC004297]